MHDLKFKLTRIIGYLLGFVLFYEPFMLFGTLTAGFFEETGFASIHVPCARIPLANLVTDEWQASGPTSLFFCLLLAVSSLWFGPLFCGRLCPAGAFSELLGSLLPSRWQIDWPRFVPILPLRYGFFTGFLFSVRAGFGVPCTYCNYYSLEIFVNLFLTGHFLNSLWSLFATFLLANIVLGLFTRGGRGYCLFLCPVGAYTALFHMLGQYLPGPFRMQVRQTDCIGCGRCTSTCPMRAISLQKQRAAIDNRICIVCGKCAHTCPRQAICYRSNLSQEV